MSAAALRVVAFGLRRLDGVEGGIETHARQLYPRLAAAGHAVTVLTRPQRGSAPPAAAAPAPAPTPTPTPTPPECRTLTLWAPHNAALETLVHSVLCTAYCLWTRPDVVHIHAIGPAICTWVLKAAGLRVVLTHHGRDYDAEKWSPLVRAMLRLAERVGVRCADEVICVSDALRRDIAERFAVNAHTLHNGVSPVPRLPPAPPLSGLVPGSYVLMVGRMTAHKRVLDVLEAMDCAALHDTTVVVCGALSGPDPNVAAVRARAARQRNVRLAGFVQPRDLPWLYANALCTVMASSYEGMPFAVLEALGAGSTVLLSDIPAHRELGLPARRYFPVADVARIRALLERLRREPWRGPQPARPLDSRFDWSAIAHATGAVYRAAAARRTGRTADAAAPAVRRRYDTAAPGDTSGIGTAEARR